MNLLKIKRLIIVLSGIALGILFAFQILPVTSKGEVIGFLSYSLLNKASKDYSPYITTLAYFGLTIDTDGTILKLVNPQEEEPGWHALRTNKLDAFFDSAIKQKLKLSLVIFSANDRIIDALISDPTTHAQNLVAQITPIMQKYKFSDLNLDIEQSKEASDESKLKFTTFVKELKRGLDQNNLGTLTVDIAPIAFVKNNLADPQSLGTIADHIVIMAYDYHSSASQVTGPIAPLNGAGSESEFDVETPLISAIKLIPKEKIILGLPLYGYEWGALNSFPRAAIIPGTAATASNRRVEQLIQECRNCKRELDNVAKETYLIYEEAQTPTIYNQIFYPDAQAMKAKLDFASKSQIGGVALWALGYEGQDMLEPLKEYKQ